MVDLANIKITNLFFYQAMPGMVAIPRQVPAGNQEIEVILSGYGDFMINGKATRLGPGNAIWFAAEDWINVHADHAEPYRTIMFVFDVAAASQPGGTFAFEWENPVACCGFCRTALMAFQLKNFSDDFAPCLYSRMIWEAECSRRRNAMSTMPDSLGKVLNYLERHYDKPVHVADIAAAGGFSVSRLHAVFRRHVGASPFQYVLQLRLNKACRLLTETVLPVKQVCDQCGFSDIKNFCAYFKRSHQLTPGGYRRLARGSRE